MDRGGYGVSESEWDTVAVTLMSGRRRRDVGLFRCAKGRNVISHVEWIMR